MNDWLQRNICELIHLHTKTYTHAYILIYKISVVCLSYALAVCEKRGKRKLTHKIFLFDIYIIHIAGMINELNNTNICTHVCCDTTYSSGSQRNFPNTYFWFCTHSHAHTVSPYLFMKQWANRLSAKPNVYWRLVSFLLFADFFQIKQSNFCDAQSFFYFKWWKKNRRNDNKISIKIYIEFRSFR